MTASSRLVLFLAACLAVPPMAHALSEGAAPPAPSTPPFVAPVPDRAQWVLTVPAAGPAATAPAPRRITKLHFAKTGRVLQRTATYSDGTTAEVWFVDGLELDPDGPGGAIQVVAATAGRSPDLPLGSPFLFPSRFPGTEWVELSAYAATEPFRKTPACHYAAPDPDAGGQAEAWIDAATKLPLGFVSQGTTYLYEMQDPPVGALVLPPAYRAALDQYRKASERRSQLDAGPPR